MGYRSSISVTLVLIGVTALAGILEDGPHSSAADIVSGRVTHVRDGDTIEVVGVPIRLQGLDCAERGTRLGEVATAAVRRLVSEQHLSCELNGDVTNDRQVGRCYLPSGDDVAAVLIGQGVCGRCARYDPFRPYARAQAETGPYKGDVPGYCRAL